MESKSTVFFYDYGDNWQVSLTLEECLNGNTTARDELPQVVEGYGYGIVEDCGGVEALAEAVQQDDDPPRINIADLNYRLKRLPRIFEAAYEEKHTLSTEEMAILRRMYLLPSGK